MVLARDCAWVGSLAGSSSIYYKVLTILNPPHTHTHTHNSLAGILTLSGDEVVGSMVALKERRGMTCWVIRLPLRHSCMRGCLSVSPSFLFSPSSFLHSALLLTHTQQLWNLFSRVVPALSDLLLTTDHGYALCSSEFGAVEATHSKYCI